MSLTVTFSLKETPSQIERMILERIRDVLKNSFKISALTISKSIKDYIFSVIQSTPEWESIRAGKLRQDFGIPDGINVDLLLETWSNEFEVKVSEPKISGNQIVGDISISIIDESYKNVLASSIAEIQSKGGSVFWLEWLLFAGDNIVVDNYHVIYGLSPSQVSISRTGDALMAKGGSYKVDSIYSGTRDNNFITRALDNLAPIITDITQKEVMKHI